MSMWPRQGRDALQEELHAIAEQAPGHWSFCVREDGQTVAEVEAGMVKSPASTIKVAILVMALQEVAAGRAALDQMLPVGQERAGGAGVLNALPSVKQLSLAEVAELMIVVSDNEATNMLIRLLGLEPMPARLASLGMPGTRLERTLMDTHLPGRNVTTAADQAALLDALSADLLPDHLRTLALDMLLRQQFNSRMPARLGPDVLCRHKTGEITGIRHDVGILECDDRQIAFAALGSELQEAIDGDGPGPVDDVIARATQAVVTAARMPEHRRHSALSPH